MTGYGTANEGLSNCVWPKLTDTPTLVTLAALDTTPPNVSIYSSKGTPTMAPTMPPLARPQLYRLTFHDFKLPHAVIVLAPSHYVASGIVEANYPNRSVREIHCFGDTTQFIDALVDPGDGDDLGPAEFGGHHDS